MKRTFRKYPSNYIKSSFDAHHLAHSSYGGFKPSTFDTADIYGLTDKFEQVLGDPENARYAACCTQSDISSSDYIKVLFTDDLSEANSFISDWLSWNNHTSYEDSSNGWISQQHYYGTIIDLVDGKEIDYGDIWQLREGETEDKNTWHKFGGM